MNRSVIAGALALASAATCLVLAPAASAATQACVTTTLTTGLLKEGTTALKSATSSCGDLNLTYSDDKSSAGWDFYAGRLRRSDGSWFTCARGYANEDPYIPVYDGSHSINDSKYWLCTDVNDNTRFGVASYWDGGDVVKITH
ncbi:hypothetical protein ACWCXB_08905 [Streptomyces sp. NPDC001514]